MLLFMSMVGGDVFELRPPTGLLFISQLINENEQTQRNDIDGEKLLIQPGLSANCNSRII
jgi:hypothetical protein